MKKTKPTNAQHDEKEANYLDKTNDLIEKGTNGKKGNPPKPRRQSQRQKSTSDNNSTPVQRSSRKTSKDESQDRPTVRSANRGKIDFYSKQAVKIRESSRGSKRGSTSPLRGGERNKVKLV